jgi:vacuolar-type H+-ATPase subunit E/Vma4
VVTGRAEAARLLDEARLEAESIRRGAEAEAREIVTRAEAVAAAERDRAETELRLAVRDVLLGLRATLTRCLQSVVRHGLGPRLRDPSVLTQLLGTLVREYAAADAAGGRHIEIRVPDALAAEVSALLLEELGRSSHGEGDVDVQGALGDAGFEYRIRGAQVDMTLDAVVEQVRELVRPELWRVLAEAAEAAETEEPGGGGVAAAGHLVGAG